MSRDIVCRDSVSAIILISILNLFAYLSKVSRINVSLSSHGSYPRASDSVCIGYNRMTFHSRGWIQLISDLCFYLHRIIIHTRSASFRSSATIAADLLVVASRHFSAFVVADRLIIHNW